MGRDFEQIENPLGLFILGVVVGAIYAVAFTPKRQIHVLAIGDIEDDIAEE